MAYGTVNADVVQSSVSGVSLGAGNASIMKNRIINGAFTVNQYALGTVTPTANQYIIDRWIANVTTASKYSVAQSSVAPAGFVNSALITSTSAYSVVAGDYESFQQRIEANNMSDIGWGTANAKTVTLSFWVQSSLTGTFGGSLYFVGSTTRTYPYSYSIPVANTWTQISITIPGDIVANTAPTGTNLYVIVQWGLGVGSTYTTATTGWQSGNFASPTSCVNILGTSGATFYITGVQLEVGSSATGFEYRQYQQELALCQRYCPVISSPDGTNTPIAVGLMGDTTHPLVFYKFPVTVRSPATGITVSAASQFSIAQGTAAFTLNACNALTFSASNTDTASLLPVLASGSGLATGYAAMLFANSTSAKIIFTGCEL